MAAATDRSADADRIAGNPVHGTVVAAGGRAALIRGPSGAGKSDLALRCLAVAASDLLPHPARLVADDRVELVATTAAGGGLGLLARAPASIRGLLEVRGVGILPVPWQAEAELRLVVDLVAPGQVERLPPEPLPIVELAGCGLPRLALAPFEPSAPLKLLLALARV